MTAEVKWIAIVVAAVALLAGGFAMYRSAFDSGKSAGKAEVQTAWDKNRAAIQAVTDKAIADATRERDAALEANGAIQNDYQTQLSAAKSSAGTLAAELRDARARLAAGGNSMQQAGGRQGPADPSANGSVQRLDELLGAALAEAAANRAQLDALIAEVKPWL